MNTGLLIMKIAAAWILMSCEPIRFQIDEREGKKIRKAKHYLIWKNNDAIYDSPMLFLWTLSF